MRSSKPASSIMSNLKYKKNIELKGKIKFTKESKI